jgi:hypothetical protein
MDFWFASSLLNDCCDWGSKAVEQIADTMDAQEEMVLQTGLGLGRLFIGAFHTDTHAALMRALVLARACGDLEYQQRALYGLCVFLGRTLQFRVQLAFAQLYERIVQNVSDPTAQPTADLLIASA